MIWARVARRGPRWLGVVVGLGVAAYGCAEAAEGTPDAAPVLPILTHTKTVQLDRAQIWSALSYDGGSILLTTMFDQRIVLKTLDLDLTETRPAVPLTTPSDLADDHIADHAHVLVDGVLYVAFSNARADAMYAFRADRDGQRLGGLVPVQTPAGVRTNDMHLFASGAGVHVLYGSAGTERTLKTYDTDLRLVSEVALHLSIRLGQLGSTLAHDGGYLMFTGDETQHDLVVSRWDSDWTEATPFWQTLVASGGPDWNYFASGAVFDPANGRWYIAYSHFFPANGSDTDAVALAAFDASFQRIERQEVTGLRHFRPHLLLVGEVLVLAYDRPGAVFVSTYRVAQGAR